MKKNNVMKDPLYVDDIEGAQSKRQYRGPTKDIFKVDLIEGASPHKLKRNLRPFAFDDYKDVTTATRYRRPFLNSSQSIESQYFSPPRPEVKKYHK